MLAEFFNKEWRVRLLLFTFSVCLFTYYFKDTFSNLNSMLAAADGDGMKNYYTFLYHTINDTSLFETSGLNYPYGEHIVYTDCQPILTFLFKPLPFTHGYLVGILHFLMIFSFIITPNILYSIFRLHKLNMFCSALSAISISLMIPQMDRMGGHFGLSYGCMIPIAIYLISKYALKPNKKNTITLFIFNSLLFLFHPYLGLGSSIFTFVSLFIFGFKLKGFRDYIRNAIPAIVLGIGPILAFMIFMKLTDTHAGRPPEPAGIDKGLASIGSVFAPEFGPFQNLLEKFIPVDKRQWEGRSYIGFFPFVISLISVLLLPFYYRRIEFTRITASLYLTAILLLIFSFGWHAKLLDKLHITIPGLNQFRSLGRFAWFFYFMTPIFSMVFIYRILNQCIGGKKQMIFLAAFPVLFFTFNFIEGHQFIKDRSENYLKMPNVFLKQHLSENKITLLAEIEKLNYKAILPIPYFSIGSEVYERDGREANPLAMILSYHSKKPFFGGLGARTSIEETKSVIDLFNEYKKHSIDDILKKDTFLILKMSYEHMPNEMRLINRSHPLKQIGETSLYLVSADDLSIDVSKDTTDLAFKLNSSEQVIDTLGVYFVKHQNRKPFMQTQIDEVIRAFEVPKNKYTNGLYTISFHYHFEKESPDAMGLDFVVAKILENGEDWQVLKPLRQISGYYNGNYGVFEMNAKIDPLSSYRVVLLGAYKNKYQISHFMIRPAMQSVRIEDENGKVFLNNYPVKE